VARKPTQPKKPKIEPVEHEPLPKAPATGEGRPPLPDFPLKKILQTGIAFKDSPTLQNSDADGPEGGCSALPDGNSARKEVPE
jgi:hypothetical protein